jgi:hypothetical protein
MSEVISTTEARGAVEKWLLQVQDVMLLSIRDIIEKSVQVEYKTSCYRKNIHSRLCMRVKTTRQRGNLLNQSYTAR